VTLMRLFFSGQIKKAEHRDAGGKPLVEVSICKKHKGRNGAEDTFTWAKVTIWEPAEFQVGRLVKGALISGSGDVQLRSYTAKDGSKGTSLEVRSSSFDVEVEASGEAAPSAPPAHAHAPVAARASAPAPADDEPPF
jgi:single-stranded DNA-binding protein